MVQTRIEFEFNKKKSICDINHVEWGVVKDFLFKFLLMFEWFIYYRDACD